MQIFDGNPHFCRISENYKYSFTDRVDILLCSERNKDGVSIENLHLWPPRSEPLLATSTPTNPTTPSVLIFVVKYP